MYIVHSVPKSRYKRGCEPKPSTRTKIKKKRERVIKGVRVYTTFLGQKSQIVARRLTLLLSNVVVYIMYKKYIILQPIFLYFLFRISCVRYNSYCIYSALYVCVCVVMCRYINIVHICSLWLIYLLS